MKCSNQSLNDSNKSLSVSTTSYNGSSKSLGTQGPGFPWGPRGPPPKPASAKRNPQSHQKSDPECAGRFVFNHLGWQPAQEKHAWFEKLVPESKLRSGWDPGPRAPGKNLVSSPQSHRPGALGPGSQPEQSLLSGTSFSNQACFSWAGCQPK